MARKFTGTDFLVIGGVATVAWLTWQTMFGHKRRIEDALKAAGGPFRLERQLTQSELAAAQVALLQDMNEEPVNEAWVVVQSQDEPSLAVSYEVPTFGRVLVVSPTTLDRLMETGSFATRQQNAEVQFAGWRGI